MLFGALFSQILEERKKVMDVVSSYNLTVLWWGKKDARRSQLLQIKLIHFIHNYSFPNCHVKFCGKTVVIASHLSNQHIYKLWSLESGMFSLQYHKLKKGETLLLDFALPRL